MIEHSVFDCRRCAVYAPWPKVNLKSPRQGFPAVPLSFFSCLLLSDPRMYLVSLVTRLIVLDHQLIQII